jgi:hypothetical protein
MKWCFQDGDVRQPAVQQVGQLLDERGQSLGDRLTGWARHATEVERFEIVAPGLDPSEAGVTAARV